MARCRSGVEADVVAVRVELGVELLLDGLDQVEDRGALLMARREPVGDYTARDHERVARRDGVPIANGERERVEGDPLRRGEVEEDAHPERSVPRRRPTLEHERMSAGGVPGDDVAAKSAGRRLSASRRLTRKGFPRSLRHVPLGRAPVRRVASTSISISMSVVWVRLTTLTVIAAASTKGRSRDPPSRHPVSQCTVRAAIASPSGSRRTIDSLHG